MGKTELKELNVRIPADLHRRLKLESVRRTVSMQAIVEQAIRELLAHRVPR